MTPPGGCVDINIASTFDKPGPLFLNRPLVSALNDLDIGCGILLEHQNSVIAEIEKDQETLEDARELLVRFGLGWSGRLVHLFTLLIRQSRTSHRILSEEPFLKAAVNLVKAQALRSLKESARIPIPGWHLVGVPDLDSYLKEGEIYACVRETNGKKTYLSGRVAVTRSPTMDPGDVRIVRAVGRLPDGVSPRNQELVNCVVFPVVGLRSFASKMSGGGSYCFCHLIIRTVELTLMNHLIFFFLTVLDLDGDQVGPADFVTPAYLLC